MVEAWKKLDELHADDAIRKNAGAVEAMSKPQGSRSDPSIYLSEAYIAEHLKKFEGEVSTLAFDNSINKYKQIGRDDGLFVMPKQKMDELLVKTKGDVKLIEIELGIPPGTWSSKVNDPLMPDKLIRIDIKNSTNHELRMATGNEAGANELWIPGGKTPKGNLEAVINPISLLETNIYTKAVISK